MAGYEQKDAAAPEAGSNMDEEAICRYCLDGTDSGPLISPCNCKGGQEYVHLSCLRQWQRMVLVSQPTHPDFYGNDVRHQTCNVCKSVFTCPPPTRHELMESFTGLEIAALIEPGCIIGAHEVFSLELEHKLLEMNEVLSSMCGYRNWIRGVYLITEVTCDDGLQKIPVRAANELEALRRRLGDTLTIDVRGSSYRLIQDGALSGVPAERLAEAFKELKAPCEIVLAQDPRPSCGDDQITAVGLQRKLASAKNQSSVDVALRGLYSKYPGASKVEITYFSGGPCETERIVSCLVLGGSQRGWKSVKKLVDAVQLAYSLSARRHPEQGDFGGGQTVRVAGLKARQDLNGETGLTLQFIQESGRWMVRLRNGEGVKVKPGNLESVAGAHGQVYAFWGDARWTRTQLLGEIARGHWGLCKASTAEVTLPVEERWKGLEGRMAFAPQTAMTDDFMRDSERQMAALRTLARTHGVADDDSGDDN